MQNCFIVSALQHGRRKKPSIIESIHKKKDENLANLPSFWGIGQKERET